MKFPETYHFNWQECVPRYTQHVYGLEKECLTVNQSPASIMRGLLLQAAQHAAIHNEAEAKGKCFMTSVEFAIAFSKYTELRLIRWEVTDDSHYCEHWAVGISDAEVIDLTHVQVDGTTEVLHQISSYPKNYIQMKQYPISIVPQAQTKTAHNSMQKWAPLKMRLTMLRHDLAGVPFRAKQRIVAEGILELARFTCWLLANNLLRHLETRQKLLDNRLREP